MEPLPITLGPNWQPGDIRLMFVSASGASSNAMLEMAMTPDPPTGFSAAYSLNPGIHTHGVYYKRLQAGDVDNINVAWARPTQWQHFMFSLITVRGISPTVNPSGGWLNLNQNMGDTAAAASSVPVPGPGIMLFFAGSVPSPWGSTVAPSWAVSLGAPSGWTSLVATDKSGATFYQWGTDPSLIVIGKQFSSVGSTGTVTFPTSQGTPAFSGLYAFLTTAADVSFTVSAA